MSRELHIHRLTHDTVHEIADRGDISVELLMSMLANGEDHSVEYQFVFPDPPEEKWEAGGWWRVRNSYGSIMGLFLDEPEARKHVMDGYTLERTYRTKSRSEWRKVS